MITILSEGEYTYSEILKRDVFNLKVSLNDKPKTWSPNNKHGKLLQQAFGIDIKLWVGQKVQIALVEDTMLIKPIKAQKA